MKKLLVFGLAFSMLLLFRSNGMANTVWSEDFSGGFTGWSLFGSPQSKIVDIHGYTDVFDNNGDGWCGSGAISDATIDIEPGMVLTTEVYLQVDSYTGCWVGGSFGFTNKEAVSSGSCAGENYYGYGVIGMNMVGEACWASPSEEIGHSFVSAGSGLQEVSGNSYINKKFVADDYVNGWYTLKAEIIEGYYIKAYLDDTYLGTTIDPIPEEYRNSQHIMLGHRSSDVGGKVYFDNLSISESGGDSTSFSEDFDDGDFTSNPTWTVSNGDDYPGAVDIKDKAVRFYRTGAGGNGGGVGIQIETNIAVGIDTVVQFDGKAQYRSVGAGCGWTCGEYPVNVLLYLEDSDGNEMIVKYVLNYGDAIKDKDEPTFKQIALSVPQGEWVRSIQYKLKDAWSPAARITKIYLGGNGWDFEGYVDNLIISDSNPNGCTETDTGALDVAAGSGTPGGSVSIPVRIQSAPNAVSALGFELTFPASFLTFTDYTKGSLVDDWTFFEATNPESGVVRVGGFTSTTGIVSGQSGYVAYLNFAVSESCEGSTEIALQNLKDDIAGWSTSSGCMDCDGATCDINGDSEITPQDALCAFQKYMGICPTACGDCANVGCDVNQDEDCTPADALEIFKEYMGIRPNACSP